MTLRTPDGLALRLHRWPAPTPRGRLQIAHGLGEHAGRYAHVAAALNAAGWDVVAHDHRGHGASGGARGVLARDCDLLADLGQVADHWRGIAPLPGPQVLLGHSMGGAIASRFVAEALAAAPAVWSRPFDGLVLSSPALAARLSWAQRLQLAIGRALAPSMALGNGLAPEWVSRDPATVRAYTADTLNHDRITPRLAGFILDAGHHVRAGAPRWRTPTLLMWAGADRCVDTAGSVAFAAAAPGHVVTTRPWPDLCHELFNEPERDAVVAALCAWLDETFPPSAMPHVG
jgi:alpha-beta hydrolase superfamily lysophospholipase